MSQSDLSQRLMRNGPQIVKIWIRFCREAARFGPVWHANASIGAAAASHPLHGKHEKAQERDGNHDLVEGIPAE